MTRKNSLMLLACTCAIIGAEQLIMGAIKNDAKKPTLNERLTALEEQVSNLTARLQKLENGTTNTALEKTDNQIDQITEVDAITSTTPSFVEPTLIPLEDMLSPTKTDIEIEEAISAAE